MSMSLEEFKRVFSAYVKDTADANIVALVEDGLKQRFPRLDPQHAPNLKMLADVLHDAATSLAAKLPAMIKPQSDEASAINATLPDPNKADLSALSDKGWQAKTAYVVVEALQSDWLNHTPLGTFQQVVLERPGNAAEWCENFKNWVGKQGKLAAHIAGQLVDQDFVEPLRKKAPDGGLKAQRRLAEAAGDKSDSLKSAKARFNATAAAYDRLVAGADPRADALLPQLNGDIARLRTADRQNAIAKVEFEQRKDAVEAEYSKLSSRGIRGGVRNKGFAAQYETAFKPLADAAVSWRASASLGDFVSALGQLERGEELVLGVPSAFDRLDAEWGMLGADRQRGAEAAYAAAKSDYQAARSRIEPRVAEMKRRQTEAQAACQAGKYPADRKSAYDSPVRLLFALDDEQRKLAAGQDFANALKSAQALEARLDPAKLEVDRLDGEYAAARQKYAEVNGRLDPAIADLERRSNEAKKNKPEALAWVYASELQPILAARAVQRKEADKENFLIVLPKANELEEPVEDAKSEFDNYDEIQSRMTDGAKQSEINQHEKKKSEYKLKDAAILSLYKQMTDRFKVVEITYPKARVQRYIAARSPAGSAWLKQGDIAKTGDFAAALEAAAITEAALMKGIAAFDRLDAEWAKVKADADQIVSDVMSMPRKHLAALEPAEKARMMNELAAIDTTEGSDYRKAQYALLKSMKLDPASDEKYTKLSERVADALAAEPMLKDAKANWAEWTKDAQSREENYDKRLVPLMKKILEIQSESLGFEPPEIESFEDRPTISGEFSPTTKKIKVNRNADSAWDLKELINTLTHENTHNYQDKMLARRAEIKEGDPDYQQLLMFAANAKGGYVSSDEASKAGDFQVYKRQPQERHAFKAGDLIGQRTFEKL